MSIGFLEILKIIFVFKCIEEGGEEMGSVSFCLPEAGRAEENLSSCHPSISSLNLLGDDQ